MSEEIKEMNPDDKNHKKDSDGYEKICYLCHRPESKVDKMITIPNQITICSDCMQKTFDQIGMQGMPSFPGMDMMNLGSMGLEPPNEFQERHQVKTKKKKNRKKILTARKISKCSKGWTRCVCAPVCTSVPPARAVCTTWSMRSWTTPLTKRWPDTVSILP